MNWIRSERGMAMFVVMSFIMIMSIVGMYFMKSTMTESQQLYFANDSQKAQYLAEAALEKTISLIRAEMNDFPADSFKQLGDIGTNPWFWYFRVPGLFAEGGLTKGTGFNQGFGVSLNLQMSDKLPAREYDITALGLEPLVASISGKRGQAEVEVIANIDDAFGITPDTPMFEIPGISIPDVPIASKMVEFLQEGELPPIELPIPDFDFRDIKVTVTLYGIPIDIPVGKFLPASMKINIKGLLEQAGIPTQISMGQIGIDAIENILPSEIQTPDLDETVGGVAIEKIGNVKFVVTAKYIPDKSKQSSVDSAITHKIIATKEFKVADIAGPSPMHTLFIENTADNKINLNGGDGHLYCNNLNIDKMGFGHESDLMKLAEVVNFPGLIRINGTKTTDVKLGFIGPLEGWDFLAATGWTHLFIPDKEDDYNDGPYGEFSQTTGFIPKIPTCLWGVPPWGHWQWPAFGTANSFYTIPWPDSDAKTHLFGEFGMKTTWSREIEGLVKKNFRTWKACLFQVLIPYPYINFKFPIWYTSWQKDKEDELSRYGFRWRGAHIFDPQHEYEELEEKVEPEDKNRAPNVYDLSQYGKKAAYFYNSSEEFNADVEKRTQMSHDGYFNLDGVNFINSSVELPEMKVNGHGMIVSAGDIIVKGDFLQKGGMGSGKFGTVMGTKVVLMAPKGSFRLDGGYQVDAGIYAKKGLESSSGKSVINGNFACDEFDKKKINGDIKINFIASKTRPDILSMLPFVGKYSPRRYYVSLSDQFSSFRYIRGSDN